MQLSKLQRRALLRAKELRDKPFPVVGSMLRSWKIYLVLAVVLSGYSWFAWSMGASEAGFVCLGAFIGLVGRDVTWFRLHARMWPVNVEITNWAKVNILLKQKKET